MQTQIQEVWGEIRDSAFLTTSHETRTLPVCRPPFGKQDFTRTISLMDEKTKGKWRNWLKVRLLMDGRARIQTHAFCSQTWGSARLRLPQATGAGPAPLPVPRGTSHTTLGTRAVSPTILDASPGWFWSSGRHYLWKALWSIMWQPSTW